VKKLAHLIIILLGGAYPAYSQFIFQKTFGGSSNEEIWSVKPTSDGGYILAGQTSTYGPLGTDPRNYFLIKTDLAGNTVWTRTLGSLNQREFWKGILQTSDGGYLASGIHTPPAAGTWDEGVVQKLDAGGNQTWISYYGGGFDDEVTKSVQLTAGIGYAHTGLTENWGTNVPNLHVQITNTTGGLSTTRVLSGAGLDNGQDIQQTTDGGLIVGGLTNSIGPGGFNMLLAKFNFAFIPSFGLNTTWYTAIGGPGDEMCFSTRQTTDGGYILCGYTNSYGAGAQDIMVVKTDGLGTVSWARTIGGTANDWGWTARQTSDGGYIIAGYTESFGQAGRNAILTKLSSTGTHQWSKTYGGTGFDQFYEAEIRNGNTGFVAAGSSNSFGAGAQEAYMVVTDNNGVCGCNEVTVIPTVNNISPTSTTTGLTSTTGGGTVSYSMTASTPSPTMTCQCTDYRPPIEIQGSTQACANTPGLKYYFTPLPGVTSYSWSAMNATINSTSGDTVFITTGTTNARIFLRTNFGTCSDFYLDTIDITVDQIDVNITTSDSLLCIGDSTLLNTVTTGNQGTVSYAWMPAGSGASINVGPLANTNYTVTATDAWGCTSTDAIPVAVFTYPLVDIGNDTLYCDVPNVVLNAGNPGANFLWSTSAVTQTINAAVTDTYWVDVTTNGCTTRDSIDLRIGVTPTILVVANDTLCIGDSTHLSASATGGTLPYTYQWNTALGNNPNGNVSPTTTTNYVVTVTEWNGCQSSDSILVRVFPYPVVDLGNDTLQCGSAGPITLDAQNPGASYSWNTGAGTQTINVNTTNIYWVDVTANTCTTRDSISVAYSTDPLVTIIGDSAICNGETTVLTGNATAGILPYSYSWTGGGTNPTLSVSPTVNATYTLTITDSAGCSGSDDIQVTVTDYPIVFLGNDTVICAASSYLLDAGNPGFSYQWQDASSAQTYNASATGIYWVDVTNNNCTTRDSISVAFDTFPTVDLGPDQWICQGENVTLDATTTNATYNWSTSEATGQISVNSPGLYWVAVSKCYTTFYDSVTLQLDTFDVALLSVDNPYCGSSDGSISVQPGGGFPVYTYAWPGQTDSAATLANIPAGTYTVIVTDAEGCTGSLTVDLACDVPDVIISQLVTPNADGRNDTWIIQNLVNFPNNTVVVFNRWGNEVYRSAPYQNDWDGKSNSSLSIGSDYLPSGTYFYVVDLDGDGSNVRTGYLEFYR